MVLEMASWSFSSLLRPGEKEKGMLLRLSVWGLLLAGIELT
jgi:hypothetical protein